MQYTVILYDELFKENSVFVIHVISESLTIRPEFKFETIC